MSISEAQSTEKSATRLQSALSAVSSISREFEFARGVRWNLSNHHDRRLQFFSSQRLCKHCARQQQPKRGGGGGGRAGRVLTSGARVSHWGAIVLGLPAFHKFVSSIVCRLTPRFAQKCNENNNRANIILLYAPAPVYISRVQRESAGETNGATGKYSEQRKGDEI